MKENKLLIQAPKKNPVRWVLAASSCWAIIIATLVGTNAYFNVFTILFSSFILANRMHALFLLGHDAAHYLVHNNKRINDFLCYLFVCPLGFSLNNYREFHFLHHRYLNSQDDPELINRDEGKKKWQLPKSKIQLINLIFFDLLGASVLFFIDLTKLLHPSGWKDYFVTILSNITLLLIIIYFSLYWVIIVLLIGFLIIFPIIFRLRTWTEHWGIKQTHIIKPGLLSRLVFLPFNTWCHNEHHMQPNIPYWYLPNIRSIHDSKNALTINQLFSSFSDVESINYRQNRIRPLKK